MKAFFVLATPYQNPERKQQADHKHTSKGIGRAEKALGGPKLGR